LYDEVAREEECKVSAVRKRQRRSRIRLTVGAVQTLATDQADIGFTDRGRGEPVFLVHAGAFSDWFVPVSESAALDGCRVVRVRRAGYGGQAPSRHLTIADHARDAGALADHLGFERIHWVGHSSSCQIGLELALERPELIATLILLEPAAAGGFAVPASEALGRQFVGPAMAAFAAGDVEAAFDTFMRGVCGEGYRDVLAARLGPAGLDRAVRESAFFFGDEVPAVLESQFGPAEAGRIVQPTLIAEGEHSARLGPLSAQITAQASRLLPHAVTAIIPGANHLMPLQEPEAVARLIQTFVTRYVS
jgi:pimeloyl-ACP methyl ester carboxylesterase